MQGKTWHGHDSWYNDDTYLTYYPDANICILDIECCEYPSPEGWMTIDERKFVRGFTEEPKNVIFGETKITLNEDGTLTTTGDEFI